MHTAIALCLLACGDPVLVSSPEEYAHQPRVAIDARGQIVVAYALGREGIGLRKSAAGAPFAPLPGIEVLKLAAGMRRGPRLAAVDGALVVTAHAALDGEGHPRDLYSWRLPEGAERFADPVRVNRAAGSAPEGMHDMAVAPDGRLACVWLDVRGGPMQVWAALSADSGATWSEDVCAYANPSGPICPCCPPAASFGSGGELLALWRNVEGDWRDVWIAAAGESGAFGAAERLGGGHWTVSSCPMAGPAVIGAGGVWTAWNLGEKLYLCRPGERETPLGFGRHPALAPGGDEPWIAWTSGPPPARLLLRGPGEDEPAEIAPRAGFPALAATSDARRRVVLTWEEPLEDDGSAVKLLELE